jgi:hypothetical protein
MREKRDRETERPRTVKQRNGATETWRHIKIIKSTLYKPHR